MTSLLDQTVDEGGHRAVTGPLLSGGRRGVAPEDRTPPAATAEVAPDGGAGSAGLSGAALGLVLVASFMVVLDFSIVNVALPSIRQALGFGGDSVQWVVTAYAITFGGLLVLGGRIGDTFGRRSTFILGLAVFSAASLAAGLTGDAILLVTARAVQGIGAALVAPASLSLITARIAEGPRRTRALGLYGATASIGYVVGQVLGGVLVQYTSWRSIFLVNVPVGLAAALLARRLLSPDRRRVRTTRLDIRGGVLVTLGVALAVFAISEGPVLGWVQPLVIGAVVLAAVALLGFVAVERSQTDPLINLGLLRRRGLRTAAILTLLVGAWTAGELVVMSVYLQQTLHDSPLVAGLVIAPQGAVGFVTGMFGARLVRRFGMRTWLVLSTAAAGIGFLALSDLPAGGHYNALFAVVVLIGFGTVGTVFGTTVMAASGMAQADQGLVGGVVNTTRQVGAAIGVAALVAIAEGSHARAGDRLDRRRSDGPVGGRAGGARRHPRGLGGCSNPAAGTPRRGCDGHSAPFARHSNQQSDKEDTMKRTILGKSGLEVSRIAFGTWQLGGDWGPTDTAAAMDAIRRAADQGVTFFDTAQGYGFGQSEQLLAAALRHLPRQELVIATKGGLRPEGDGIVRDASAAWIREGVEASLRALGTDYVDLYQVHWPDPATPFEETAEQLGKLVADGKILHVGVSNFTVDQMEAFSATLPVETLQPPYHLFRREIEKEVLPYTATTDIGVLVYGPLAHGLLSGHLAPDTAFDPGDWRSKSPVFQGDSFRRNLRAVDRLHQLANEELGITLAQLAVVWVLHSPAVQVAIVGTRDPDHVDEALAAADLDLDDDVMRRIDQIMTDAVPVGGPSPEGM